MAYVLLPALLKLHLWHATIIILKALEWNDVFVLYQELLKKGTFQS